MTAPDVDPETFEFDPDLVDPAEELAEAFIIEEFDAALLEELDKQYLEVLANQPPEKIHINVDDAVLDAAMQVAELVVERLEAAENRTTGRPSRIPSFR